MSVDLDKLFEVDNGINPNSTIDGGPVILSDNASPQGVLDAPLWTTITLTNGNVWTKNSSGVNGWVQIQDSNRRFGVGTSTFVSSQVTINGATFQLISTGVLFGMDEFPPTIEASFFIDIIPGNNVASTSDVRIFNTDDNAVIKTITATGSTRQRISETFTLPSIGKNVEIQANQDGSGNADIFKAQVIYRW